MTPQGARTLGHKIFTFDEAIWTLQGRHHDDEVFVEYVYSCSNSEDGLLSFSARLFSAVITISHEISDA